MPIAAFPGGTNKLFDLGWRQILPRAQFAIAGARRCFRCLVALIGDARSLAYSPVVSSDLPDLAHFPVTSQPKTPCAADHFLISTIHDSVNIQYWKKARPWQAEGWGYSSHGPASARSGR